jgi:hypothetical protein
MRMLPVLRAVFGLSLFGLLVVGPAGASPAHAANPTMSPFVPGQHVYDGGNLLSANSRTTAEALAARIEAAGGGRVALFTTADSMNLPGAAALAAAWQVDGYLMDCGGTNYCNSQLGDRLKSKLTKEQSNTLDSSPGFASAESWMLSNLARVDAFLSGSHVIDGTGLMDAASKQKAEASVKDLSDKIGGPVYVDISLGGDDPSSQVFFTAAHLSSDLPNALVISLAVSGSKYAGSLETDNSKLWNSYRVDAPWKGATIVTQDAAGDISASLLSAIQAVQTSKGPLGLPAGTLTSFEFWFWVIFAIAMVAIGVGSPFYGSWLIRKISGVTGPIKGGLPGEAVIESISDTGVTVTMPSVGPDAPEYKFDLQVTPAAGGAAYAVQTKAIVPRLFIPMVVPGANVGVVIDPKDPSKVSIDFSTVGRNAATDAGVATAPGGFAMNFDPSGQPSAADLAALAGGVRSGAIRQIKGKAEELLATGTHGTAIITTAQPLGKKVRDINPAADPSRLDDPMWLFTVEVSLAGQVPFPAVFGHRVPIAKVVTVAPGVKLAVAVGPDDHNEVAIDWDKSPIGVA